MKPKDDLDELFSPLRRHVNDVVSRLERIQYEFKGRIDEPTEGNVQITFGAESVHLTNAGNGASLVVADGPWMDPFAGPQDEENREFLETHGRLVLVDVSTTQPYARVIGLRLTDFYPVVDEVDLCSGVQLWFEQEVFSVIVDGDEVDLHWGTAIPQGYRLLWAGPR